MCQLTLFSVGFYQVLEPGEGVGGGAMTIKRIGYIAWAPGI